MLSCELMVCGRGEDQLALYQTVLALIDASNNWFGKAWTVTITIERVLFGIDIMPGLATGTPVGDTILIELTKLRAELGAHKLPCCWLKGTTEAWL